MLRKSALISMTSLFVACSPGTVSEPQSIVDPAAPFNYQANDHPLHQSVFEVYSDRMSATAFAVGTDLIMTNHHVASGCTYESCDLLVGDGLKTTLVRKRKNLDYALLKVHGAQTEKYLSFAQGCELRSSGEDCSQQTGKSILIAQMIFEGGSGRLSLDRGVIDHEEIRLYGTELFYKINTLPGSSGSPLLDENNEVVGIHWGESPEGDFNRGYDGVQISSSAFASLRADLDVLFRSYRKSGNKLLRHDLYEAYLEITAIGDRRVEMCFFDHLNRLSDRKGIEQFFRMFRGIDLEARRKELYATGV